MHHKTLAPNVFVIKSLLRVYCNSKLNLNFLYVSWFLQDSKLEKHMQLLQISNLEKQKY